MALNIMSFVIAIGWLVVVVTGGPPFLVFIINID